MPARACVPTTSRSARRRLASFRIASRGSPSRRMARAETPITVWGQRELDGFSSTLPRHRLDAQDLLAGGPPAPEPALHRDEGSGHHVEPAQRGRDDSQRRVEHEARILRVGERHERRRIRPGRLRADDQHGHLRRVDDALGRRAKEELAQVSCAVLSEDDEVAALSARDLQELDRGRVRRRDGSHAPVRALESAQRGARVAISRSIRALE